MPHVFISYSSRHRELTRTLVEQLEAEGYSVWWDNALEAWGGFEPQIRAALAAAQAVVVVWSEGAAKSDYVYSEAMRAYRAGRLVHCRAPEFPLDGIPQPFDIHHCHTLNPDGIAPLLKSLATAWRGEAPRTLTPLHLHYRETHNNLDLFATRREARPGDIRDFAPSAVLQACYEVVPYVDATGLLGDMLDWCRSAGTYAEEERATAGRLLFGPGGFGKTRLMIEACRLLREDGWLAGFAEMAPGTDERERIDRGQAIRQVMAYGDEPGVLMVLDYAEARRDEVIRLARLARPRPREGVRPVRVVLLSRGDAWWQDVYREVDVEILFQRRGKRFGDVIEVAPPPPEARRAFYAATLEAYRPLFDEMAAAGALPARIAPPAAEAQPDRFAAPTFARPLALQMAALLELYGAGEADGLEVLLDKILDQERRHWTRVIDGLAGDAAREETLRRGVAQVTAVGGTATRRGAEDLLAADTHFGSRAPAAVPWRDLHRLYGLPGRDGGLAPLEPDLVGEHEAALSSDERLIEACLAWIASLPETQRGSRRRALITVLQRATRAEHGSAARRAEAMLAHLVTVASAEAMADLVAVAVETPGRLVAILENVLPVLAPATLAALSEALPWQTVTLAGLADSVIARRQAELPRDRTEPDQESEAAIAKLLHARGRSLHVLGHHDKALAATEQAVAIRRRLCAARPDVFEPDLALSLNNLGVDFTSVERPENALAAAEESVAIYRRLAAALPERFDPELALSLTNLGICLSDLGQPEDALTIAQESAAIYERLAALCADKYEPGLAAILNVLGTTLSDLGRWEAALEQTEKAVTIFRRLARQNPDAFEPNFAVSLNNVGVRLSSVGRHEDALAATKDAVAIYRRLASVRPDSFAPDLAMSLSNLGIRLSNFDLREEALTVTREAVDIYRGLISTFPGVYELDLAVCLSNLGADLSSLERFKEALKATDKAVRIYRRQASSRNDAVRRGLAASLNGLGHMLAALGKRDAALAAIEEAVDTCRALVKARHDGVEPELALSLNNLGERLVDIGRFAEAEAAATEGIALVTPHFERYPDAHMALVDQLHETLANARRGSAPSR